ncbi:hypothetical protein F4556_006948 [Kitasatospora gansuensis]|uniref:Uncharacterized protein n=1 Tax=Kitasatospora gansuensis TaxID=258050 RepID=A0A7W7SK72_9ACTN|nr:hypothetical protein [Kitasatospora gansuensis]MBB4951413.1 hypothetical protein [Kitasatospora gansuensis]
MPRGTHLNDALPLLRREVESGPSPVAELTAQDAWLAFLRFGRQRFDTAVTPGSDGLLFQYGTYAFSGPPMFTVDFTRQFDINDDDGEHCHYVQVHCELRYPPDPALRDLGSFNSWFFHDTGEELEQWAEELGGRLDPLRNRRPAGIHLYEGPV